MSNSLYEQLKSGTSAEDIAAAFAEELNKAEEQLRVEREAEEKARAEEKAKAARVAAKLAEEAAKIDEAATLLRESVAFISHYYPSFGLEDEELTEDEYRALAELLLLMLDLEAVKPTKRQFKLKAKSYTKPTVDVAAAEEDDECTETVPRAVRQQKIKENSVTDPFADFFKAFGL